MFARFLEISLYAPQIEASIAFYERLGLRQLPTGDAWEHPYAVLSDGRLFLGLHARALDDHHLLGEPVLSFVIPQLAEAITDLQAIGVQFDELRLGAESFHRATFSDPGGQRVQLLEARTFSPPVWEDATFSDCGYFSEYALPSQDAAGRASFWEALGFIQWPEQAAPVARTQLSSDHLNLALYRSRAFRQPQLTFEAADMPQRLTTLRARNLPLQQQMPDTLDAAGNASLQAPEGTALLLLHAPDLP